MIPRELALHFGLLSLISIGGMLSVIPEMHRYVVDVKRWITPGDFIQMFAIRQAAPGPNVLIAGLIGSKRLGHSKPSSTITVYGHLIPSQQEGAAQRMDHLICD